MTLDGNDYYIAANDEDTLTLEDRLGVGFPASGSYSFVVEYILIQTSPDPSTISQQYQTSFRDGGAYGEPDPSSTVRFPYSGLTLTMNEVQDPTDGVN